VWQEQPAAAAAAAPSRARWGSAAGDAAQTALREVEEFRARQAVEAAALEASAPARRAKRPHELLLSPSCSSSPSDTPARAVRALREVSPEAEAGGESDEELEALFAGRAPPAPPVDRSPDAAPEDVRPVEADPQAEAQAQACALREAQERADAEAAAVDAQQEALSAAAERERHLDMLRGCRSVEHFERLNHIDEGTYGVVFRARDKATGRIVALKKVKMEKEKEGFPLTSLREIAILLSLRHPNVVNVTEVVVGNSLDSVFMVMEYMEHDLKGLLESQRCAFTVSEVKCLFLQLLSATQHLHANWVLHRDLKTSNVLVNNRGELKLCDFGMARAYGSPLRPYTPVVCTLWYRAPELLLGSATYSTAVDMWSLGCILAELLSRETLLPGRSELDQLDRMFKLLGTPTERVWPAYPGLPLVGRLKFVQQPYNNLRNLFPKRISTDARPSLSDAGFDLLNRLLSYDPQRRLSAEEALEHPWFQEVPLPKDKALMPTMPSQSDGRAPRRAKSPGQDPLVEQARREELAKRMEGGAGGLFAFAG